MLLALLLAVALAGPPARANDCLRDELARRFLGAAEGAWGVRDPTARAVASRLTAPTNQNKTLQCWAVSSTAAMDAAASARAGRPVKLSAKFVVYAKTRAEVLALARARAFHRYEAALCEGCAPELVYYEQGGVFPDAVEAARVYGAMPEEAYPGFPEEDLTLFRRINTLIGEAARDPGVSEAELAAKLDRILAEALGGPPPERFTVEGRSFGPREYFAEALPGFGERGRELEYDAHAPRAPASHEVTAFDGAKYAVLHTSDHGLLIRRISDSVSRGKPILIRYHVVEKERTQRLGRIGFAVNGLTPRGPEPGGMEHYVLAVLGQYSRDGRLVRLLVKNSWETEPGAVPQYHWIESDYLPLISGVEDRGGR